MKALTEKFSLTFVSLLCLTIGCSRSESPTVVRATDTAFIVKVDDRTFLESDLRTQMKLREKLFRKKYAGNSRSLAGLGEYMKKLQVEAVDGFVQKAVYARYAETNGFSLAEMSVTNRLQQLAAFFGYGTYETMKAELTADEIRSFEFWTRLELAADFGKKQIGDSIDASVNEEEVDRGFQQLIEINKIAAATNDLVFATATNVYKRIKGGELTFEQAVKAYSEDVGTSESGLWGSWKLVEIPGREPRLDALLKAGAKEGDILPPIECDNAALIIKVGSTLRDNITFYRIMFRLAMTWNTPSREKMREVLSSNKRKERYEARFEELFNAATIRYRDDVKQSQEK